jgi:hypothetical protein
MDRLRWRDLLCAFGLESMVALAIELVELGAQVSEAPPEGFQNSDSSARTLDSKPNGGFEIPSSEAAGSSGDRGPPMPTVNLSVFRRHPCGASAQGSACKSR